MNSKWIQPNLEENEIYVKTWQKPPRVWESHVFVSAWIYISAAHIEAGNFSQVQI